MRIGTRLFTVAAGLFASVPRVPRLLINQPRQLFRVIIGSIDIPNDNMFLVRRPSVYDWWYTVSVPSIRSTITYVTCLVCVARGKKGTLAGFFKLEDPATTVIRRTRVVSFSPWSRKNRLKTRLFLHVRRKIAEKGGNLRFLVR